MVCGSLPRCDSEPFAHEPGLWWDGGRGLGNARAYAFRGLLPGPCIAGARDVKYSSAQGLFGPLRFVAGRHGLSHVAADRTRPEA